MISTGVPDPLENSLSSSIAPGVGAQELGGQLFRTPSGRPVAGSACLLSKPSRSSAAYKRRRWD